MNALQNWRGYLPAKERLFLLLAVLIIVLLALGIFFFVAFSLVPKVGTRGELIGVVATAEQNLVAAEQTYAAAPASVRADIATADARLATAASAFLSESQATAALDRLYQYARESGVSIIELKAQPSLQTDPASVYRLITFGLRVTGAFPNMINFLARMRETALSGFALTNVTITAETDAALASMNVALYTSPYAVGATTQPITGVITPPLLPPLPTAVVTPFPTLPLTVTVIPTLGMTPTNTPLGPPPLATTVVIPTSLPATATPITPAATAPAPVAPVPTTGVGCANLLSNGDFELDGSWFIGPSALPPQWTSSQKHGGARAMVLGSPLEAGVNTQGSYSSIRQLVTLPANATVITLRWWHLYGTQEEFMSNPGRSSDRQEMLLLTPDERVLAMIRRLRRNDGAWQQETVDLTPYRGQSFYLYFNVFNNGNGAATWMYLDDVQLDTCAGATAVPTALTPLPATATNTPVPTTVQTPVPTMPATVAVTPTTPVTAVTPSSTPSGCPNLLSNGDFELDGSWIIGPSALPALWTTTEKHGGARAVLLGRVPGAGADNRGSYSSIRQLVTIPATATAVTLRWWHLYGTQEAVAGDPGTSSDRQEVLLLTPDERVLAVLQRVRRNDGAWQQETVDLTPYRGQSFSLYFNVYNNGNGASTWVYIDEVQVSTCTGATPAPTGTTPVATATNTPIVAPTITATPTLTPLPTAATCINLLNNGDFELDGGWLIDSSPMPPQWTTSQKHGGARSIALGNPPEAGVNNSTSYSSIRQQVSIPATATTVTLHWWHLYGSTEAVVGNPGVSGDRQEVLLLTPEGGILAVVERVRRNDGAWQQATVDLTPYRGRSVYFYFNVFNDGNGASTWMYVDDIRLEVCSPSATPV